MVAENMVDMNILLRMSATTRKVPGMQIFSTVKMLGCNNSDLCSTLIQIEKKKNTDTLTLSNETVIIK